MKIICAFDSFKGCMTAKEACQAAASGLRERFASEHLQGHSDTKFVCLPMSDGGEGMAECIAEAVGAAMVSVKVHDPLMRVIDAEYAVSANGNTAYMEMAAASGLTLVPEDKRNPMMTTTYGVGDMILDAISRGCKKIVMGIGGSATCDGGKGMVSCLEEHLPRPADGGLTYPKLADSIEFIVASDVSNPLYGKNGAAYVFAPQKGATSDQVKVLDERLRNFASVTEAKGLALPYLALHPGAGAAGGLGYGLMAYLGARLQSGIDLLLDTIHFDAKIKGADFIITGEGKSNKQTLMGKVPSGILKRAKLQGIPVHLISGAIEDSTELLNAGFATIRSINQNDSRPLEVLMQKNVAMNNLKKTIAEPTAIHTTQKHKN